MNKAQRKYVADFEANMAGKQYNIFDCINFATEYNQIDPTPDAETYRIKRQNGSIVVKGLSSIEATNSLDAMMKDFLSLNSEITYYNKGEELTINTNGVFTTYIIELNKS